MGCINHVIAHMTYGAADSFFILLRTQIIIVVFLPVKRQAIGCMRAVNDVLPLIGLVDLLNRPDWTRLGGVFGVIPVKRVAVHTPGHWFELEGMKESSIREGPTVKTLLPGSKFFFVASCAGLCFLPARI